MQIAVEEARTNASEGNAAVGSVVVRDENLIARGRNLVATQADPTPCGDGGLAQRRDGSGPHRLLRVHALLYLRALPDMLRRDSAERRVYAGDATGEQWDVGQSFCHTFPTAARTCSRPIPS